MMENVCVYVDDFIGKIKERYPNLTVGYEYDEEDDIYRIWHNDENIQQSNIKFKKYAGAMIKELFYKKGIFNISFGYDYDKANAIIGEKYDNGQIYGESKISVGTNVTNYGFNDSMNDFSSKMNLFYEYTNDNVFNKECNIYDERLCA